MAKTLEDSIIAKQERIAQLKQMCNEDITKAVITFEIGCGKGHYLSSYAAAHPSELCVGIDLISDRIKDSKRRAENKSATNAFFYKAEASEFLEALPESVMLDKIFIMFNDPWPKKRHHKRRLMQHSFLEFIYKKCDKNTRLFFRTDYDEYFEWTKELIEANDLWELDEETPLEFEEVSQFQRILPEFNTLTAKIK
ncbi:MAG: tRNA (guanosine(46)-N7)-methyltransferase TrmB [Opitutales bacterium]